MLFFDIIILIGGNFMKKSSVLLLVISITGLLLGNIASFLAISKLYNNDFTNLTLFENQYIVIIEDDDVKDILVYRNHLIKPIKRESIEISYDNKIQARNIEQSCLIDALYSKANIIYAGGSFGTGKSFLLTSYALQELQRGNIDKIVYVPNNSQNENSMELGTMPG